MTISLHDQPDTPAATLALRKALADARDPNMIEDLLFLERWELRPLPGTAAVLRVTQIRRANPDLAAAIRAEIAGLSKAWPSSVART